MFDRSFFQTKLGQAAIASVAAMVAFVALTTQMYAAPALAANAMPQAVEMA